MDTTSFENGDIVLLKKNLRTVARDIVCTHGVYGNSLRWTCNEE